MGAYITDRTIFTSDTKEFHFHKRDFNWLIRNFEYISYIMVVSFLFLFIFIYFFIYLFFLVEETEIAGENHWYL